MKRLIKLFIAFLLPLSANAQSLLFNEGEATSVGVYNLSHNATTGTEAAIYNPAGLVFAPGKFAVSINAVMNYQTAECTPYSLNELGDKVNGFIQNSTLTKSFPSVQAYFKTKYVTISASYASEGGVKWKDPNGDLFENFILENNTQLEDAMQSLYNPLQEYDFLANNDDCLHWSTSNYISQSYNHSARLGGSFDLGKGLFGYIGLRYNHIKALSSSDNDLFVFMPSKNKKMAFIDYFSDVVKAKALGNLTDETEQNIHLLDSLLHSSISVSYDYPTTDIHSFSPVIGLAYNYKTLTMGMKYEMSPSIYCDTKGLFFPHMFSFGISNLFWDRLLISTSADLKWGFKGNEALIISSIKRPIVYQFGFGAGFDITEKLNVNASVAWGNKVFMDNLLGITNEQITRNSEWKLAFGMQWNLFNNLMFNCGAMSTIGNYGIDQSVNINGSMNGNCVYSYSNRFAATVGLTYVLE